MILLRNLNVSEAGKEGRYDSFFAGLLGGYAVFGRQRGGISKQVWESPQVPLIFKLEAVLTSFQIVYYIFARVMLALAELAVQPNMHPLSPLITPEARTKIYENAWPVFASLSWAFVMYIFRWYPETLVSSLRSSMVYMYVVVAAQPPCCVVSFFLPRLIGPFLDIFLTRHRCLSWAFALINMGILIAMRTQITGTPYGLCSFTTNRTSLAMASRELSVAS